MHYYALQVSDIYEVYTICNKAATVLIWESNTINGIG